jgi:hypothetical protein
MFLKILFQTQLKNLAKLCTSFLFFIPFVAPNSQAGAWLVDEGKSKTISEVSYYSANKFIDSDGSKSAIPSFTKLEISNLIEYGYSSNLTLGAKPFFSYVDDKSSQHQAPNISVIELFSRHKLFEKNKQISSLENKLILPGFYNEQKNSINTNALPTKNDDADFELSFNLGSSLLLNNTPSFYNFSIGFGNNVKNFFEADANPYLKTELTFGYEFLPNWLIMPKILGNFSLYSQNNAQIYTINQKNYSLIKPQIGIVKKLTKELSIEVSCFHDLWGENTSMGNGGLISIWKDF